MTDHRTISETGAENRRPDRGAGGRIGAGNAQPAH
nr:MAG TPA: hypothetical protein [Caudoviricetes sp.]